eukprot:GDKJ01043129.1.p1 GENE.GDKJ01043129.1~~GDKJ01043129.1.p1  ORF type:complete len:106 (+),score=21.39 GDKJ01043129.1:31-348(+)
MSEVEIMLDIIAKHDGVNSVAVFNKNGQPVHQAGKVAEDKNKLAEYISLVGSLSSKARSLVRDLDPQSDLTFLRIRSRREELLIAPGKDFTLFVEQDPFASEARS